MLLPRGGFGSPRKVNGFARGSPTRGAVERSETERLYEGEPDRKPLLDSTSPSALTRCHLPYRGEALAFRKVFLPSSKFSSPPEAPLLGELSSEARLRGCTKESLSSVGKSGSWHLLYLFGETCGIMGLRPCPPIYSGGEVRKMESILSFILSVGANVAAYYICKWLDGWFTGRKH